MRPLTFSSCWPYRVRISYEPILVNDAWHWLHDKARDLDITPSDLFTTYSNHEFGFKRKKIAMEFKLRFG